MMGLRRIGLIVILGATIGLGPWTASAPPAQAQNPVGRFFNKVGDAIVNNPLTKRSKRNRARNHSQGTGEPAFDRQTRARIQTSLNELGHDVGPADGIFGRGTRRGIARYQASLGNNATGYLTRQQADQLLGGATAGARSGTAKIRPADIPAGPVRQIAGPDSVWTSLAMRSCEAEEMLACMERFGAPSAAVAFVRQGGEVGMNPGLLAGFDDFGIVDLGQVQYISDSRESLPVLLNGSPPAVETGGQDVQSLRLSGKVYRQLVSQYGELKLLGKPRLESHRITTDGGQRFVFAYRLAKCETCASAGEVLTAYDFDAAGAYTGLSLLGIAKRKLDLDWQTVEAVDPAILKSDIDTLQRRLAVLGFDPGPFDGKGGRQTEKALRAFQADHGMKQTGQADDRTVNLLAQSAIEIEISRLEQLYRQANGSNFIVFVQNYAIGLLSRAEVRLAADKPVLARLNSQIARLHDRQKDPEAALSFAKEAVRLSAAGGRDKEQVHGVYLFNLGENYLKLDRDDEAIVNYYAAFNVFEPLVVSARSRTLRKLSAKAFARSGKRLIAIYEKRGKDWAARKVRRRLETMEAQLAAVQKP